MEDIFDELHHLEATMIERGRKEGLDVGERRGLAEGRSLGMQKGFDIGEEIGFYETVCIVWSLYDGEGKEKALKTVQALQTKIKAFKDSSPENETMREDLQFIRTKFKVAASRCHSNVRYSSYFEEEDSKDMTF